MLNVNLADEREHKRAINVSPRQTQNDRHKIIFQYLFLFFLNYIIFLNNALLVRLTFDFAR